MCDAASTAKKHNIPNGNDVRLTKSAWRHGNADGDGMYLVRSSLAQAGAEESALNIMLFSRNPNN